MMLMAAMIGGTAGAQRTAPAGRGGTGLSVAPVLLMLDGGHRATSTTITNPGTAEATVQARLYAWTTDGEEDLYAPTREIGFSPAVFRLAPQADQAVRLVTLVPPGPVERAYRLIIDQLPLAEQPGQLQMPVRMVLPVFVAPAAGVAVRPLLEWSARFDAGARRIRVTCVNRGTGHAKLVDLAYQAEGAAKVAIQPGLAGYALAGQRREWSVAAETAPARLTILAQAGNDPVHATIAVAR
jgi:fimbrial chaperone protein